MQVFNTPQKVIISCRNRLSLYLEQEVRALGFTIARRFSTGIEVTATLTDCITFNLRLFCASQVLYLLKTFQAENADQLYQQINEIAWETLLDCTGYFSVYSNVDTETINTPLFANLKVKDAIVDRIKQKKGRRPDSGPEQNKAVVYLYWKDREASIYIDTSGETLSKHGYRKYPGRAPMSEALASGVIFASEWDRKSPFINPMCGSGTLAIEAALIATNRSPGLFRMNYAFMHLLGYDEQAFFDARKKLKEQILKPNLTIVASDISSQAISIAQANAKTAGVDHLISFEQVDFAQTTVPQEPGVVVFNPEYGERLGEQTQLEQTYKRIGDFMKQKCPGYRGFVFTGNPDLAKKIGLHTNRRIEFYNGQLDCRLLSYELYGGSKRTS